MKINIADLRELLPKLTWNASELSTNLTLIGHESQALDHQTIEVEITPNRGDAASLLGIAREISGIYRIELNNYDYAALPIKEDQLSIVIDPMISAGVYHDELIRITNCRNDTTPEELKDQLKKIGLQSKGLIVDLTNLVCYQIGSPLHAFDANALNDKLEIRLGKTGETIELVAKDKPLSVNESTAVQVSNGRLVDLLGVMGGKSASVADATDTIIVQAGVFSPQVVRKNVFQTKIATEASTIYLKGVAPYTSRLGLQRFLSLLNKYQPNAQAVSRVVYEVSTGEATYPVSLEKYSSILGCQVKKEMIEKLAGLGFSFINDHISIPAWRLDFSNEAIDYEIAREIFRCNREQITALNLDYAPKKPNNNFYQKQQVKQRLCRCGFTETITDTLGDRGLIRVINPISSIKPFLRSTLKFGLLSTMARNPYIKKASYFEMGTVFTPEEETVLGLLTTVDPSQLPDLTTVASKINWEKIDLRTKQQFDIKFPTVSYAEIPYDQIKIQGLESLNTSLPRVREVSRFAPATRDISLVVERSIKSEKITSILKNDPSILIAEQIDEYINDKLGSDKKSVTYRIILQRLDRSLTADEVNLIIDRRFQELEKEVKFEVR